MLVQLLRAACASDFVLASALQHIISFAAVCYGDIRPLFLLGHLLPVPKGDDKTPALRRACFSQFGSADGLELLPRAREVLHLFRHFALGPDRLLA